MDSFFVDFQEPTIISKEDFPKKANYIKSSLDFTQKPTCLTIETGIQLGYGHPLRGTREQELYTLRIKSSDSCSTLVEIYDEKENTIMSEEYNSFRPDGKNYPQSALSPWSGDSYSILLYCSDDRSEEYTLLELKENKIKSNIKVRGLSMNLSPDGSYAIIEKDEITKKSTVTLKNPRGERLFSKEFEKDEETKFLFHPDGRLLAYMSNKIVFFSPNFSNMETWDLEIKRPEMMGVSPIFSTSQGCYFSLYFPYGTIYYPQFKVPELD